jgi:transcriptional regulator with XRE-family HTH domain
MTNANDYGYVLVPAGSGKVRYRPAELRRLMRERGMRLRHMAAATGETAATINHYCTGDYTWCPLPLLRAMAAALDVDPLVLIEPAPTRN